MNNWILVVSIVAHCALLSTAGAPADFKLELVQVLFRHGDRTIDPGEIYPKDIYNSSAYEPYGYSQLTNKGKKREFELGNMLRRNYGDFLGETYRPGDVYAYSTDQDRAKMSLQLVLAGLYAPSPRLTWSEDLRWMPIPTNYNPRKFDFLSTSEQCPRYGFLFDEVVASPEIQRKIREYKDFIDYLADNTGLPIRILANAPMIYNTIQAQLSMGLPLPGWCTAESVQKLGELSALRFDVHAHTNEMRRLAVGPTIRRFLRNMDERDSGASGARKIYLYSAHDNNVMPFLRAHNLTQPRTATYGIAVILEKLRGIDGEAYIRMLLWEGAGEAPYVVKLENCSEICPLSEYLHLVRYILPDGEGTECLYASAYKNVKALISGTVSNDAVNARELFILP